MAEKRYYWLKLNEDFFQQKAVKKLRRIAGGDTYCLIYLKMLLLSIKSDGYLIFDGIEDNFEEDISLTIDEDVENVKMTVAFLKANKLMVLVEVQEGEIEKYAMFEAMKNLGSESASAKRMRDYRNKSRASQCDDVASLRYGEKEKEIEKRKDIDIEKREEKNNCACDAEKSAHFEEMFTKFWLIYPKRREKERTFEEFCKIENLEDSFEFILADIEKRKKSDSWLAQDGRFIPASYNYIKNEHWLDSMNQQQEQDNNDNDNGGFEEA